MPSSRRRGRARRRRHSPRCLRQRCRQTATPFSPPLPRAHKAGRRQPPGLCRRRRQRRAATPGICWGPQSLHGRLHSLPLLRLPPRRAAWATCWVATCWAALRACPVQPPPSLQPRLCSAPPRQRMMSQQLVLLVGVGGCGWSNGLCGVLLRRPPARASTTLHMPGFMQAGARVGQLSLLTRVRLLSCRWRQAPQPSAPCPHPSTCCAGGSCQAHARAAGRRRRGCGASGSEPRGAWGPSFCRPSCPRAAAPRFPGASGI